MDSSFNDVNEEDEKPESDKISIQNVNIYLDLDQNVKKTNSEIKTKSKEIKVAKITLIDSKKPKIDIDKLKFALSN